MTGTARSLVALVGFDLRLARRSLLAWGIPLAIYLGLIVALYPSLEQSVDLDELIEQYPPQLREAFGFESFDTLAAYLDAEFFSLFGPIVLGIFALRMAVSLVPGQEDAGTLPGVVLPQPVRRSTVMLAAGIATAIAVAALVAAAAIAVAGTALAVGADIGIGTVLAAFAGQWAVALLYAGVSAAVAGLVRGGGVAIAAGSLVLALSATMKIVIGLQPSLDWLEPVSPLHVHGAPVLDGLAAGHAGLVGVAALLVGLGAAGYARRDVG